jgi:hypothetical protein
MRTQLHLHAKLLCAQRVQLRPVHARQQSWEVGTRYHPGVRVMRHLPQPLNAVTARAKDARDFRASTQDRAYHPRHHKRSRMAFASMISMIGQLPERLDKIADIRCRMRYSNAHGLSPCETQYGFVTFIISDIEQVYSLGISGSSHGAQSEVDTFDVLLDAIK